MLKVRPSNATCTKVVAAGKSDTLKQTVRSPSLQSIGLPASSAKLMRLALFRRNCEPPKGEHVSARFGHSSDLWPGDLVDRQSTPFAFSPRLIRQSIDPSSHPIDGPSRDACAFLLGAFCLPDAAAILQRTGRSASQYRGQLETPT